MLRDTRAEQVDALDELREQGAAIDAKLAQAVQNEQAGPGRGHRPGGRTGDRRAGDVRGDPHPPPRHPLPPRHRHRRAPRHPGTRPPELRGDPGVSPHHDDPFLACVRAGERRQLRRGEPGGAVPGRVPVPAGDVERSANHAGRTELVGVPANQASPYDQDDMAWALYQWQGAGPWGGGC